MISWIKVIDVGHTSVMVPAAAAITVWLATGRAWRMALWWSLFFMIGIFLVAASKIAFLGWGTGIRSLDFKALSGHAMRTTAVMPVLFYLLLQRLPIFIRVTGVLFGIALGIIMGALLVTLNFHTASEAIAGCILGGFISVGFIWISNTLPAPHWNHWLIPFSLIAFLVVWYVKPSSIVHWIVNIALYLSGHDEPYNWSTWELDI